jgi:hypothetical protein
MALGLDILTRIINVHWEDGLAVDFGKQAEDAPIPAGGTTTTSTMRQSTRKQIQQLMMRNVG